VEFYKAKITVYNAKILTIKHSIKPCLHYYAFSHYISFISVQRQKLCSQITKQVTYKADLNNVAWFYVNFSSDNR